MFLNKSVDVQKRQIVPKMALIIWLARNHMRLQVRSNDSGVIRPAAKCVLVVWFLKNSMVKNCPVPSPDGVMGSVEISIMAGLYKKSFIQSMCA